MIFKGLFGPPTYYDMELEICSMNGGAIWVGWVKMLGNGWYKVANVDGGRGGG